MRQQIGALAVAIMFASAATMMAANLKTCYAHAEDLAGVNFTAVWTSSAAHASHELDVDLGDFATAAECQAAFDTYVGGV
jgi:hypothetical protein